MSSLYPGASPSVCVLKWAWSPLERYKDNSTMVCNFLKDKLCLPYQSIVINLVPRILLTFQFVQGESLGMRLGVKLVHTVDSKSSMKFLSCLQCSPILRLSPHVNFHTASDRKLGGTWEQGYLQCAYSTHTPQLVGYLHCLSFVLTMHTYAHTHAQTLRVLMSRFSSLLDLIQKLYTRRH